MAKEQVLFCNEQMRRLTQPHKRIHCAAGDREHIDYQPVYDVRGIWHLEEKGKTNKYLEIQSHADSCDLNILMARYRNGETDVLSRIQGVYGDVSQVPRNYAELMNQMLKAQEMFNGLSPDVREKYGNSVEQFMASLGTKEGWEAIGFKQQQEEQSAVDVATEVKSDE